MYKLGDIALLAVLNFGTLILAPFYRAAVYFIKRVTAPVRAGMKAVKRSRCHADHS